MRMWSMKVIILLLFCYAACLSTGDGKVDFVSKNFYNVLQWDPVKPAVPGEKVLYSVWYWNDTKEQPFQLKKECQNITDLSCDLTAETPSVHDVHYRAQLYVNGRFNCSTMRFKPIEKTALGPPILATYTTVSSLHVNVTLPLGPNGVSVGDIISRSKNGPYKTLTSYILKITHPKWAAQTNKSTTGRFVINLKNNQTEYCGHVVYKPLTEWGRPESERTEFCITLPGDPLMLLPWLLVSAALLTAVITVAVVCMCNYVKGGKEKSVPQLLITTSSTPPRVLQPPDRNISISKAEVCVKSDQTLYATIRMNPNITGVKSGGYSPQDIPVQAWQDSGGSSVGTGSTPKPEAGSAQSSEIYSVVAVHVPAEPLTGNLPVSSSGEGGASPKPTPHGVPPLSDLDPREGNSAMPLLLETVRDANGQLVLPSLIYQLQNCTDDKGPPLPPERKPLLSDLIHSKTEGPSLVSMKSSDSSEWSDSGCYDSTVTTPTEPYCNSNYSPSQPVAPYLLQGCQKTPPSDAVFESAYKQTWMPASRDSYRKTDYPWTWTGDEAEEDEDRRGEGRSRQILLGGWVVQIQE